MATHSSILSWKSPQIEEPGEQQSIGSQRVRHNCEHIHQHIRTHTHILIDKNNSVLWKLTKGN